MEVAYCCGQGYSQEVEVVEAGEHLIWFRFSLEVEVGEVVVQYYFLLGEVVEEVEELYFLLEVGVEVVVVEYSFFEKEVVVVEEEEY